MDTRITADDSVGGRRASAYLATLAALDWAVFIVWDPLQTASPTGATATFLERGLFVGAALGLSLLPAAVLTLHLTARLSPRSIVARAGLGVVSWVGWYLVVAATILVARTIGLWAEGLATLPFLLAGAGAAFVILAGRGSQTPPGRLVTILAVGVGALLIVGCFVTAGWWGGPA